MSVILNPVTGRADTSGLTIIVPRGYEDEPPPVVGKCLIPDCGATFYKGEEKAYQMHAARCARANMDKLHALSPAQSNKGTVFDPAARDLDLERHFRSVADNMRREHRWTVKPHERTDT